MEKSIYAEEYRLFLAALRAARESAGLTQVEVASRLNETQSFVSKCERGERRLDVIELRNWCIALGTTIGEFITSLEKAHRRTAASKERKK
ncbi:helix-turn-helix domain-containing protein [Ralstonia nicotianae]